MLVLRYLRDNGLGSKYVSELTGLLSQTICKWDQAYDENYRKINGEDLRGRSNLVSEEFISLIKESAKNYIDEGRSRKRVGNIKSFIKWLKRNRKSELKSHPFGKSRRIITEILIAHNLYKAKASSKGYKRYTPRLRRYYPGAQVVLDGKKMGVKINGNRYEFNLEMCKDIKSDSITSHQISEEETGGVVFLTIKDHILKHGLPECVLVDNSKANLSVKVEEQLKKEGILRIEAFPWRPETKGAIEGEFGKISSRIGNIEVTGNTEKELAESVLRTIVDIYAEMSNQTPRCSGCPLRPVDLMKYEPTADERANAAQALRLQQQKAEENRKKPGFTTSDKKAVLIQGIIDRNRLEITDKERFYKTLNSYDTKALQQSENDFYVYSCRDNFDERKRTGHYFVGIVRNKQRAIDDSRKEEVIKFRYFVNKEWEKKRVERDQFQEEKRLTEENKKYPEKILVIWLVNSMNLLKSLGKVPNFFVNKIKRSLKFLVSKQNIKKHLERLKREIMSLTEFDLEQRLEMVKLAIRWIDESKKVGIKSVTLF